MVIPFGVGGSELLVRTIRELNVIAIYCTRSYPAVLERVIAQSFPDLRPRDLRLRLAILTGEPGLENEKFRARVEEVWGFRARKAYGLSDILVSFAAPCGQNNHLHFLAWIFCTAIINPESGEPLPFEPRASRELVLTQLHCEGQPLVRFRTGDVIVSQKTAPAEHRLLAVIHSLERSTTARIELTMPAACFIVRDSCNTNGARTTTTNG